MPVRDRSNEVAIMKTPRKATLNNQLQEACTVLEHYHMEHTIDLITRFKSPDGNGADIYVVQDQEWKQRIAECVKEIFPPKLPS